MWRLLKEPYPVEEPARRRWVKAFWIGAFVGLFLLIFQPFGLGEWETPYKVLKLLGFGLITFGITAGLYILLPALAPGQFRDERWTVGREIGWVSINMLLIGLANYVYLKELIHTPGYGPDLLPMVLITFLIGLFPTAGSVVLNYIVQLKKYSRSAAELPLHEPTTPGPGAPMLTLTAENEKDVLRIAASDLLFIESSDNYCTVYFLKDHQAAKTLLRSSLSRLETQLGSDPAVRAALVRCHRSFVVNLNQVEKVTGNAQGYKLHLLQGTFQIPVARKYNETLVSRLKTLP
ncbi:LytR/AlgR family response regulator transcription factor [Larkinella soli]|uniref:LytR/AlgR family response regulator transcription factor n=1 Tax=Larkinella soli TaxID=1770527 RepID=UPI000FFB2851|nr:LytTR family DNA-binding domain-containing protein [Larkinella soli]